MADEEQLELLTKGGVFAWNDWRRENPNIKVDLSGAILRNLVLPTVNLATADLTGANLTMGDFSHANLNGANLTNARAIRVNLNHADLTGANLTDAWFPNAYLTQARMNRAHLRGMDLTGAQLGYANLGGADLTRATLVDAYFRGANLHEANLSWAMLNGADLTRTDLSGAILSGAVLARAIAIETDLNGTILKDCYIYGISAWDLRGVPASESSGLIITPKGQPDVTVDDLEIAQFAYLLLNNPKIRGVLDTIGRKGVLILGRFTPERKLVLDGLREKLRSLDFIPMMFDFDGAQSKDFTETIQILAGMSRFIIADITNPKSSPLELQAVVPDYMVPFVPIIQEDEAPFSMFANLQNKYDWMLDVLAYRDVEQLLKVVVEAIIQPALDKEEELIPRKTEEIRKRHAEDYH